MSLLNLVTLLLYDSGRVCALMSHVSLNNLFCIQPFNLGRAGYKHVLVSPYLRHGAFRNLNLDHDPGFAEAS